MKTRILMFLISFGSLISMISCDKYQEQPVNVKESPQLTATGPFWRDCPNETWDGVLDHPCAPPSYNCVVVCGEKLPPNLGFAEYDMHVADGTISEYYKNGEGQNFLPLRDDIYDALINHQVTIVRVPSSTGVYYAVVDN
jgi:hypothetical protein